MTLRHSSFIQKFTMGQIFCWALVKRAQNRGKLSPFLKLTNTKRVGDGGEYRSGKRQLCHRILYGKGDI